MIPLKLQIILFCLSGFCLMLLINMIIKYKLELKYSLLWIFLNVTIIVLSIVPNVAGIITSWIGIEAPVNAIFLFGIIIILIILFSITVAISSSYNKLKDISQELGIYKRELEEIKKNIKSENQQE